MSQQARVCEVAGQPVTLLLEPEGESQLHNPSLLKTRWKRPEGRDLRLSHQMGFEEIGRKEYAIEILPETNFNGALPDWRGNTQTSCHWLL